MTTDKTPEIAALNHLCRRAMGVAGRVYQTPASALCRLKTNQPSARRWSAFDAFTDDDDPHGERDFGSLTHNGQRIFWKIDYYDPTMTKGSEDPSDPRRTVRVLTFMLASEW